MNYEVLWKAGASRDLDQLPPSIPSALVEFIYGPPARHPERVGKPLRFHLEGKHSAHRGNCRVIYEIVETRIQVEVIAVQHLADAYH